MATTFTLYPKFKVLLASGGIHPGTDTWKIALVSSTYTPSTAHEAWSSVSANEITGDGYTAGGATLSGVAVTADGSGFKIDAIDTLWSEVTVAFRYAVLYASGTIGWVTNPLIGYITTGEDVTATVSPVRIIWDTAGVIAGE